MKECSKMKYNDYIHYYDEAKAKKEFQFWADHKDEPDADKMRAIWTMANGGLKAVREHLFLSQTAFAEQFGLPKSSLQHWEAGHQTPPTYLMQLISYAALIDAKAYSVKDMQTITCPQNQDHKRLAAQALKYDAEDYEAFLDSVGDEAWMEPYLDTDAADAIRYILLDIFCDAHELYGSEDAVAARDECYEAFAKVDNRIN